MEDFFSIIAVVVALASFPCGYLVARYCTKNIAGRVVLTIVFGIVLLVAGLIGTMAGCSALGGSTNMH